MPTAERSATDLRADAARNHRALIEAARTVFGDKGLDAPLDEISKAAGTGNATLYRHFPNRSALIAAVFAETLDQVLEASDRALANPDPWDGFSGHVLFLCQLQANDRGMADLLTMSITGAPELERRRRRAHDRFQKIARRAKDAGVLRPDFLAEDLLVLLMANAGLVRRTAGHAPSAWHRSVVCMLDGLRAGGSGTTLPPSPGIKALRAAIADYGARFGCS